MAAADTIWRVFVTPDGARRDPLGFYKLAARLRPNDSNHLISNAKFREQHELIGDVGNVLRLNVWEVEVKRRTRLSLAQWAAKKPTLSEVQEIADYIALRYVEGDGMDLYDDWLERVGGPGSQDQVYANTRRIHNLLLLYEELSYAMNAGDIGRVETLLPAWIPLFRAVGKHKYGSRTLRFMHSLYFVYPERLRRAIRYNILVNPTGKPNEFRAVDWIVEFLNLLIKYFYGGEGSNYTKERILLESVLVLIYRNVHKTMERNFALPGITIAHGQPNMQATFKAVLAAIVAEGEKGPNEYVRGRRAPYVLPDSISDGVSILKAEGLKKAQTQERGTDQGDVEMGEAEGDGEQAAEAEDEEAQLEGGLGLTVDDLSTEGWL
ncbi:hypothetical protein C2E23DRAFT_518931 [Lenzites betulinus]|nr:hypothetical protein C2E23DRAFT_518931 [Lenzites betulinus]